MTVSTYLPDVSLGFCHVVGAVLGEAAFVRELQAVDLAKGPAFPLQHHDSRLCREFLSVLSIAIDVEN